MDAIESVLMCERPLTTGANPPIHLREIAVGLLVYSHLTVAIAQALSTAPATDALSVGFGDAVPNERFVHEFQRQVTQRLQSALDEASREQDERLRQFAEQQNQKLRDQSDALLRTIDELQTRRLNQPPTDSSDAPHVNVRRIHDESSADRSAPVLETRTPDIDAKRANRQKSSGPNLSPHGFVEGRLLNGVVAVVGGSERESVVALTGAYQAANGFLTDLDGCFALVQGRPELPAGRIDFKVSRLTCNFPDGASKTWDVSGWLVDTDGIRGLRAQIVQSAGRKAVVAAAGGAVAGFGRHLSQQQFQISAGPFASSSTFIGNAAHDAVGGSAEGAVGALEQSIGEYYNLYAPSLQVGGGTPASLVIANELKFPPSGNSSTQTYSTTP